ncbi:MAG: hypothetical protein CL808_08685 [Citromicrobium sp.]|nr:hypothetical protein [Citromicrobium sp.]
MVKGAFSLIVVAAVLCAAFLTFMPEGYASEDPSAPVATQDIVYVSNPVVQKVIPKPEPVRTAKPAAGMPPRVSDALRSGVLIVISKGSQEMYVFKDGTLWGTSPVSTGKPGHDTPIGIFPILQKKVFHRSNIYSNAPMPHMQRLTWTGIAIHAGRLPGYPASHGCIRLPADFAKSLYQVTGKGTTTVVVTNHKLESDGQARQLALAMPMPRPGQRGHLIQGGEPRLADLDSAPENLLPPEFADAPEEPQIAQAPAPEPEPSSPAPPAPPKRATSSGESQTIQLAAKGSPTEAEAYWARISARHPELERYEKAIIPAVVGSKQYYRLRVSGPGAYASCTSLKRSGTDCFPVK